MRNPEDTKYVWDEKNFSIIQKALRNNSIDNMTDDTESLIKEKNLTEKDIYWLEMEQDSYRNDKEKFEAIQKTIDKLKVT
jgi:hypothetical protein